MSAGLHPNVGFDPAATRSLRNGIVAVSQLGVGCAPFGALDATAAAVHGAFDTLHAAGLRYFDVAPLYGVGLAEHRLGTCLRNIDRRGVVLSTKVGRLLQPHAIGGAQSDGATPGTTVSTTVASAAQSATSASGSEAADASGGAHPLGYRYDYSYDATLRSLDDSMRRIGTDAIDIVLIHDVNRRWQGDLVEQRYGEAMRGAYRALHELRAAGTIKAIGVGVNDWSILERFAADGDFDCFMLAGRYTLLDHTALDSFLPDCARRDIGVLMAAPFNSGILATGARPGATFFYQEAAPEIVARTQRIEAICARHGVALAAAALQFPLRHPVVKSVVTGIANRSEAIANLAHCRTAIPEAFWDELKHEGLIARSAP